MVIVAHPDDETLWAGGTILMHPETKWTIVVLCRKNDPDRSVRFNRALVLLRAQGRIGDLDDGPQQTPLSDSEVQETVLSLLSPGSVDLIVTHSTRGEYTRHRRHEETGRAVHSLWRTGRIAGRELWMFAYEDHEKRHRPEAITAADRVVKLPANVWKSKYDILTKTYGFGPSSFEAQTTPVVEAFWCFGSRKGTRPAGRRGA